MVDKGKDMQNKKPKVRGAIDIQAEERKKSGLYSLLLMLVVMLVVMAVGAFLYLSPLFNQKATPELNQPAEVVPLPETKTTHKYEFYEILPEQKFNSIPEDVSVETTPSEEEPKLKVDTVVKAKPDQVIEVVEEEGTYDDTPSASIQRAKPDVSYILQVRSYDNADEADVKRSEVLMAGVDAEVVKREMGDGGVLYQVVSTPMTTRDEAMTAYNRLQTNGIDSVVVEQKYR